MNEAKADAHYQLGLDAKDEREYKRAAREFQQAIALNPNHALAYQEYGWLAYGMQELLGTSPEDARKSLESAIKLDATLGDAHMYLGFVMSRLKRHDDSEAHFRMALGLTDDPSLAHCSFAYEFLWRHSRYGEAEQHFRIALDRDPDNELALRNFARMLACHGRDTEAEHYFSKALEIDPDDQRTIQAYEKFQSELAEEDRDPDEWLRDAIAKDPNYLGGIECLNKRNG